MMRNVLFIRNHQHVRESWCFIDVSRKYHPKGQKITIGEGKKKASPTPLRIDNIVLNSESLTRLINYTLHKENS